MGLKRYGLHRFKPRIAFLLRVMYFQLGCLKLFSALVSILSLGFLYCRADLDFLIIISSVESSIMMGDYLNDWKA